MKKKIFGIVVLFFIFGLILPTKSEQGGGNTVTCFSESRSKPGATYWDCGDCKKYFNSRGYGSSSTCITGSSTE